MDNIKNFYSNRIQKLKDFGVQSPEQDYITFCSSHSIKNLYESEKYKNIDLIDSILKQKIDNFFERREQREPLERIMNQSSFLGRDYIIAPNIFKPGFETETTVDHALLHIQNIKSPRILDCGTGSGCILISILKERSDATGIGIDIDPSILEMAKRNAEGHGVLDRAEFLISDWGSELHEKFDLIISNPPRIPTNLIQSLVKEVAIYDPHIALDGGKKGIDFYKRSAELMQKIGKPDAVCVLQVGQVIIDNALRSIESCGFYNIHIGRSYKYTPNCIIFHNTFHRMKNDPWHKIKNSLIRFKQKYSVNK